MSVKCHDTFTPIELDLHEAVEIGIILGTWKIVVSLYVSVSLRLYSWEKVCNFVSCIVMYVSEGFNFRKPLNIFGIVFEPDCSMESHLVVLNDKKDTI